MGQAVAQQCEQMLRGGANDLGGTLWRRPSAGWRADDGSTKTIADIEALAAAAGLRPRVGPDDSTARLSAERAEAARRFDMEVHRVVPLSVGFVR